MTDGNRHWPQARLSTSNRRWEDVRDKLKQLEAKNHEQFIETFGLDDELLADVDPKDITLSYNPLFRYRPDTVGTVLHYLRDFRDKLTHHADHQQMLADSASASKSEKVHAIKDVAAIKKQLKELEDYEKTLFEVAARKIDIDLADGVKHNYQLFGSVLHKIPGLDAKED